MHGGTTLVSQSIEEKRDQTLIVKTNKNLFLNAFQIKNKMELRMEQYLLLYQVYLDWFWTIAVRTTEH